MTATNEGMALIITIVVLYGYPQPDRLGVEINIRRCLHKTGKLCELFRV
jgi:hypothetical protein